MIPIIDSETLDVRDEKSGITYKLKYLTGDKLADFLKLHESQVKKNIAKDIRAQAECAAALVDLFLVGWEGEGIPAFPKKVPVSTKLKGMAIMEISNLISENIGELVGISIDELKNL